jgi:phosphoglycolate phosphatase
MDRRTAAEARDIRAILLDKDGTLLDFHATWLPVIDTVIRLAADGDVALAQRIEEACGLDAATRRVLPDSLLAASGTREIAAGFIAAGSRHDLEDLTTILDRHFQAAAEIAVPAADLAPLLARLRRKGLRLGIASSDSEIAIRTMMRRFELGEHIEFVSGYDTGHGLKPGPGMLLAFARQIDLPPRQIAVVGDNMHDMRMAEQGGAGLRIAVLTGTGDPEKLAAVADACIPSIAELETVLPHLVSS